jgi:integrase
VYSRVTTHINTVRAKGRIYYYHRVSGERLPDDRRARYLRVQEINAALAQTGAIRRRLPDEGSMADLIELYKGSPEWKRLAARTRDQYARYLDWWGMDYGDLPVSEIDREFIIEARDSLSAKPRTADFTIQVLSLLLAFAVNRPRRFGLEFNPAQRIGKLADPSGYKPWPDNLLVAAREKADDELRWVIDVARFTGLRGSDLILLTWGQWTGRGFEIPVIKKSGEPLWVPAGPELKEVIAEIPKLAIVVLTTKTGLRWTETHLRHRIAALVRKCGFPGYTLHGLRKLAGKTLAENGATTKQIKAILGHKSDQMAELYTRAAEQRRLAEAGIRKIAPKSSNDER